MRRITAIAVAILFLVPIVALAQGPSLSAGAAKLSLVPPFPTQMGGFFDRLDTFTGVTTPVYARALVLDNGATKVAVVATDLIAISWEVVEPVRKRIASRCGIPEDNILITAAHNHSGPSGFAGSSTLGLEENVAFTEFVITTITDAVLSANDTLRPARMGFRMGQLSEITSNRQQGNDTVIDPDVGVLRVTEADSRATIAVLFNFTGHPVIVGSENLTLCGEYPGQAQQFVEDTLGGVALFTQGACGDVTMKRSGPPFEEVKRIGNIVGAEVVRTAEMIPATEDATLHSVFERVQVAQRDVPSVEDAEHQVAEADRRVEEAQGANASEAQLRTLRRDASASRTTLMVARAVASHPGALERSAQASVQVMQLGPVVVVGIPGELFVEYGLEMKKRVQQSLERPMMLVGYANDYIGYIVTPRASHTGGYEQAIARVGVTAGRTLTEKAMELAEAHVEPAP